MASYKRETLFNPIYLRLEDSDAEMIVLVIYTWVDLYSNVLFLDSLQTLGIKQFNIKTQHTRK